MRVIESITRASSLNAALGEAGNGREVRGGGVESAAYAARYYRARPALTIRPAQPQDVELMRRRHEMPEASGLLWQFGPHKGNTLAQVATDA